ncbi:MAG: PAS domain-containing protein [Myxococcota bacterium]|nr:PAS domain-containing protein [Myxococcota bacterium]
MEVYSLPDANNAQLDTLPFGIIRLGHDNRIIAYNRWESDFAQRDPDKVIGKCFFTEVAPCTNVRSFHGVVRRLQDAGVSNACEFDFVFEFDHGYVMVFIQAIYNATNNTTLLLVQQKQ